MFASGLCPPGNALCVGDLFESPQIEQSSALLDLPNATDGTCGILAAILTTGGWRPTRNEWASSSKSVFFAECVVRPAGVFFLPQRRSGMAPAVCVSVAVLAMGTALVAAEEAGPVPVIPNPSAWNVCACPLRKSRFACQPSFSRLRQRLLARRAGHRMPLAD